MSTITTKNRKETEITHKWWLTSQPEKTFTADNMIKAYERGKLDGKNEYPEKIKDTLNKNIKETVPVLEKFYNQIPHDAGRFMMLQITSINYFQIVVALSKDVFFDDDKCRPIYKDSFEVCKELENINISFIPYNGEGSINFESLMADNYLFVYGNKKQSRACPS
jgi:hypothetical protein